MTRLPRCLPVRYLILALILLLASLPAGLLAACAGTDEPAGTTGTTPAITEETSEPGPAETTIPHETAVDRGPSGTLRLWWTPHDNFNPLLDKSQTGQAAATLVFESLVSADSEHVLRPVLASAWTYHAGNRQLTVNLRDGVTFHDGQPLTAQDVKACIDFIQTNAAQSPYAAGLAKVTGCSVAGNLTVVLQLAATDPWLAYALDFPILPASALKLKTAAGNKPPSSASTTPTPSRDLSLVPGTGRFRMADYKKKTGLTLELVNPAADRTDQVRTIVLKEYDDVASAMKAFERDQLDLVSLAQDDLAVYTLRNSLRLERYTSNTYVMLAFNTTSGPMASDRILAAYKQLCLSANWLDDDPLLPGEAADVPVAAAHASLGRKPVQTADVLARLTADLNPDLPAGELPTIRSTLAVIVPKDNVLMVQLADHLKTWLKDKKQACQIRSLGRKAYLEALAAKNYDLVFCEFNLPDPAEPGWLYNDPPNRVISGVSDLPTQGLADYNKWRNKLPQGLPLWQLLDVEDPGSDLARSELVDAWHEILTQTAARSPYAGILLRAAGLAYGDRVSGQCTPTVNQPYQGIEELWVWSGQSSSSY